VFFSFFPFSRNKEDYVKFFQQEKEEEEEEEEEEEDKEETAPSKLRQIDTLIDPNL